MIHAVFYFLYVANFAEHNALRVQPCCHKSSLLRGIGGRDHSDVPSKNLKGQEHELELLGKEGTIEDAVD